MAGTETRQKTPPIARIVGDIVEYAFGALVTSLLAMLLFDDVLARFDITNPGFGWYFSVVLVIGAVTGFVTNVSKFYRRN